jgi:uncharacterized protein
MSTLNITAAGSADYPALLVMNEEAIPAVNSIPLEKLLHLHRQSAYLGVARRDGVSLGFLLALPETADYDSINFDYFRRNYPRFVYVDRIVVSASARRAGVGAALYEDLQRNIAADCPRLTCEVNLKPRNHRSLAFHQKMGFAAVGEQDTESGGKRVCLMTKVLGRVPA